MLAMLFGLKSLESSGSGCRCSRQGLLRCLEGSDFDAGLDFAIEGIVSVWHNYISVVLWTQPAVSS